MSVETGSFGQRQAIVFFERREIQRIMGVYGRMVAAGEWRDYSMDGLSDVAVFSIFRHAAEHPIYRIEKRPSLAARQGQWSIIGLGGVVLKRGQELEAVLRFFDKPKFRVVD